MFSNILILGNVIAPIVAGLFFLLFFLYFTLVKSSTAASYKYFTAFLITFSVFLFGRPLQIMSGPHPLPLIICNIRFLLLCSVCAPLALLTTGTFAKRKEPAKKNAVFIIGFILGIVYVLFDTLGTHDSYVFLKMGHIRFYDTLTPSLTPPFYGREITLLIQFIIGFGLLLNSFINIFQYQKNKKTNSIRYNTFLLFNYGTLCFGFLLAFGSLLKQWWLIYLGSMVSAVIVSRGVLLDIRDVRIKMERVIPFIKEEFIQNITFTSRTETKIQEMIQLLGKESFYDTLVVVKLGGDNEKSLDFAKESQIIQEMISDMLLERFEKEDYLLMRLGSDRLGICLSLKENPHYNSGMVMDLMEKIRRDVEKRTPLNLTIGIGRSYLRLEDLKLSYQEATSALEYALKFGENQVVHVDSIQKADAGSFQFPLHQREELLFLIRNGKTVEIEVFTDKFIIALAPIFEHNFEFLKVKIIETVSLVINNAIQGGGNEKTLLNLSVRYYKDLSDLNTGHQLLAWFKTIIHEVVQIVAATDKDRTNTVIKNAKMFIENNYQQPITVNDIARAAAITPSHLMHLFKEKTGGTLIDHLTAVRIKKAKDLLEQSDLGISAVAREVGYPDPNYFSRIFKNIVGMSPREFKNQLR